MIDDLIKDCKERRFQRVFSRTVKSNLSSIEFHKAVGFEKHEEDEESIFWVFNSLGQLPLKQ